MRALGAPIAILSLCEPIREHVGHRLRAVTREILDVAQRSAVLPRRAADAAALAALARHGVAHHRIA